MDLMKSLTRDAAGLSSAEVSDELVEEGEMISNGRESSPGYESTCPVISQAGKNRMNAATHGLILL